MSDEKKVARISRGYHAERFQREIHIRIHKTWSHGNEVEVTASNSRSGYQEALEERIFGSSHQPLHASTWDLRTVGLVFQASLRAAGAITVAKARVAVEAHTAGRIHTSRPFARFSGSNAEDEGQGDEQGQRVAHLSKSVFADEAPARVLP